MSVSETSSTAAASDRLSRAIHSSPPRTAPRESTSPAIESTTTRRPKPSPTTSTGDAVRGASAAPEVAATGANAAEDGAAAVMGSGQPGSAEPSHQDAYAAAMAENAQGGDVAEPSHREAYATATADQGLAPEPMPTGSTSTSAPIAGVGAWSPQWQQVFEELQLAPADLEYLATSGYSDNELNEIAKALGEVQMLESAPSSGAYEESAASSAETKDSAARQPTLQAYGPSAWSPQWAQKFSDLMGRMGMTDAQVKEQLATVESQPISEEQLQTAYTQMEQSLGAFDDGWRDKFTSLLKELKTPADEQEQVLQQLAGSGLTEAQLTEAYTQMEGSKPGWNEEWDNKFKALQVPDEMLKQLKDSGAPKTALEQQYQSLLDMKMEYHKDGRLEKMRDVDASNEELWGIMTQGIKGEDFDKAVEGIRSSNVPAWKRIGSFALNLIPGVYALQFVTGKDWVTGDKIDRSNPLNIVGAVASGFAGFTAIRSAVAGVQGLTALNSAAQATKAAAGGAALADAVTGASALTKGSFSAIEAAGLVAKFDKGLKFTDYLKSAVPLINRFGEAGRLSSVGRGYMQSMQLTAGMAGMKSLEGGRIGVDQATKATVLSKLKEGSSIQDALTAAGRSSGTGGGFANSVEHVVRDGSRYGFLQGGVGKLGEGNRFIRGSGNFNMNPFRSTATVAETATANVFSLGRGVNFGSNAGLAQGMGLVRGANNVQNAGLYAQAAQRATGANNLMSGSNAQKMAGVSIGDDVQRIETLTKTTEWANKLGVTGGSRFRSLLQIGRPNGGLGSSRAINNVAGIVENGSSAGYRFGRHAMSMGQRYASYAAVPVIGGAAIGMTGKQMQPMWEYWKNRKEIQAEEAAQREVADTEAAELERIYAEQHGGAAPVDPNAPVPGAGASSGAATGSGPMPTEPTVVGTSPSGGEMVLFPQEGVVVDQSNGDVYDPDTRQLIGNLAEQPQGQGQSQGQPQTQGQAPISPADAGADVPIAGGGEAEVYVDQQTGYYVDPQTGLMADPNSGQVYDQQGNVVGNVNQPAA